MWILLVEGFVKVNSSFFVSLSPLQQQSQLQVDLSQAREGGSEGEHLLVGFFRTVREGLEMEREGGRERE